jgi:hypothetical protein
MGNFIPKLELKVGSQRRDDELPYPLPEIRGQSLVISLTTLVLFFLNGKTFKKFPVFILIVWYINIIQDGFGFT